MGRISRDGVGQTWLDKLLKRDPRKVLERRENNDLPDGAAAAMAGELMGCDDADALIALVEI